MVQTTTIPPHSKHSRCIKQAFSPYCTAVCINSREWVLQFLCARCGQVPGPCLKTPGFIPPSKFRGSLCLRVGFFEVTHSSFCKVSCGRMRSQGETHKKKCFAILFRKFLFLINCLPLSFYVFCGAHCFDGICIKKLLVHRNQCASFNTYSLDTQQLILITSFHPHQ